MGTAAKPPDRAELTSTTNSLDSLNNIERAHQRLWTLAFILFVLVSLSLLMLDASSGAAERIFAGVKTTARVLLDQYGTAVALSVIILLICAYFYEKLGIVREQSRQLVGALEANARLLGLRNHQLDTWDQLSHQLITNFNLPRLLELIARTAAEVTESDCSAVMVAENDSPHLRLAAIYERGMQTELARRVACKLIETGKPVDLRPGSAPEDLDRPDLEWQHLVGIAATPLLAPDAIKGALLVGRLKPEEPFPSNVAGVLQSFGSQASIALEKAQLYAESQKQLQRLAKLLGELRSAHERLHAPAAAAERADAAGQQADLHRERSQESTTEPV